MRILGIDPGYDRLGLAIVEKPTPDKNGVTARGKETVLYSSCFTTSAKDPIHSRLLAVGQEIAHLIKEYKPDAVAIENLFITKNQKTAMHVAEARGIIIYEASKAGLPVTEYTPMQIKVAVTGDGRSDKQNIIKMIHILIKGLARKILDDEYDAIAVALTHAAFIHNSRHLQK